MEMGFSAWTGAMGSLLRKLNSPPQAGDGGHMEAAYEGIHSFRDDLEESHGFLRELSELEETTTMADKCWMKEVRELSYDIEDFLDEIALAADAMLIAGKVSEFRERAQEASQRRRRTRYGLCHPTSRRSSRRRCSSSSTRRPPPRFGADVDVAAADEVARWVANDDGEEELGLKVAGVVGAGGTGKTALAGEVYRRLGGQFERRAFVRAAEKTDLRRLLRDMLSQLLGRHHKHLQDHACVDTPDLVKFIRESLYHRRYLIIIDDLWSTSLWNYLRRAFPEDNNSSRIIITSQVEEIASSCCNYHSGSIFKMRHLTTDNSRKLFSRGVLGSKDGFPGHFREISADIINRCGGLPLAIVNAASLLASQLAVMDEQEHWNIYNSLASNLRRNSTTEDDLVKQWVAEGFVDVIKDQDLEEIAGNYFDELVERRMVQPVDVYYDNKVISCTVHSMVHDFIAHRSIEDNFIIVLDNSQNSIEISDEVRRLSLHFGNARYAKTPENISFSQVRTLGFFGATRCLPSVAEFKILRVLILYALGDKRGPPVVDLHIIGELHKLRYLKVSCDSRIKLPTRISRLKCLETLEIEAKVTALPSDIVHLTRLLHLHLPDETNLPDGFGKYMTTLVTLVAYLDLSGSSIENVESLVDLINLQDLHLTCCNLQSVQLLWETMNTFGFVIESLVNLKSLSLAVGFLNGTSSTDHFSSATTRMSWQMCTPPPLLQRIDLSPHVCTFSTLPNWIREVGSLCILKIAVRKLGDGDMDVLGGLSALTVLSLHVSDAPEERIIFREAGFPVLSYLKLRCSVANLAFEERAMPRLRRLVLGFRAAGIAEQQPGRTPVGMEHLLSLEVVTARIDASCANEADRMAAESALRNVVKARNLFGGIAPVVNIRWVDRQITSTEESKTVGEDQPADYPTAKNEFSGRRYGFSDAHL
uniref:NB-ARC domain-containing protein n=1 Tax=Oryza glumipatula TaxID=40148 RepID=A0A0E0B9H8_9ORYZ